MRADIIAIIASLISTFFSLMAVVDKKLVVLLQNRKAITSDASTELGRLNIIKQWRLNTLISKNIIIKHNTGYYLNMEQLENQKQRHKKKKKIVIPLVLIVLVVGIVWAVWLK